MKKQSFSSRGVILSILAILFLLGTAVAFSQARGDVNNDSTININDALMIARYTAGMQDPNFVIGAADVDCSSSVNITDALVVARYTAGLATICTTGTTPTRTPTPTPTRIIVTPTPGTRPSHVSNPFSGVSKWYVNEEWAANARANGGSAIANYNTVVWMDRIAAIDPPEGMSLVEHLDACLAQGADLFTLMIYDLPHRDCSASASNGELVCDAPDGGAGMQRYKTEFIDPIVAILDNPKYWGLRIIAFLETDSLPNLVTNIDKHQKCREASERGCYVKGIQYALNKLYALTHVYKYLEISHSAWLGWDSNFGPAIDLYTNTVRNTEHGTSSIDGFVDNTCNTLPNDEPYMTDGNQTVGGQQLKASKFYDFNPYIDEFSFSDAWYSRIRGSFTNCGMIIDTARNGWGGPNRPTRASTSTDVNIFVDQSRIDRRFHRGNWCNNKYAGIGERPKAAPRANTQAFVWLKPPGESDGVSKDGVIDPQDPAKKFDIMCDPNGQNTYCSCGTTDARTDMPHAGRWNTPYFQQLMANAYPPIN